MIRFLIGFALGLLVMFAALDPNAAKHSLNAHVNETVDTIHLHVAPEK